jgi:predicted nucleic acid-binding protein
MSFVLDASIALTWVFDDEAADRTDVLLERLRHDVALVPSIWLYEIATALIVAQRRGRLTEAQAIASSHLLQSLPIEAVEPPPVTELIAIAVRHGLSAYDGAYLDLAERMGLPLATVDLRLRDAARGAGVVVVPD